LFYEDLVIDTAEDPQYMKERIAAAGMYPNLFGVSIGTAFLNLESFHQRWMGQNFVKKTGVQAVADSLKLSFLFSRNLLTHLPCTVMRPNLSLRDFPP
jgi:hypothetical protein